MSASKGGRTDESQSDSSNTIPVQIRRFSSLRWGAVFGIVAAFLYTQANIGLRDLSTKVDFVLVAAVKATCTAAVAWPWPLDRTTRAPATGGGTAYCVRKNCK